MRCLVVTETPAALPGTAPFVPNHTVVALNATATEEILQSADLVGGTYATIATVPAGRAVEVVLNKPFVQLASAGFLVLLGN
jgi:hypothetical protein